MTTTVSVAPPLASWTYQNPTDIILERPAPFGMTGGRRSEKKDAGQPGRPDPVGVNARRAPQTGGPARAGVKKPGATEAKNGREEAGP